MQPDQGHHPDYNFIMNPEKSRKKGFLSGGDKKQRLLMMIISAGLVLLVLIIGMSVLFGGSSNSTDKLVKIAQQQTELIRVAELADNKNTSADTKNFAETISLTLTSSEHEVQALITKQGRKLTSKELALGKNTETDAALTSAQQANRFDEVFTQTMQTQLSAYQKELSDTYKASKSNTEKTLLQKLYNQTKLLLPTK